jgi:hypothetical protein
MNKSPKKFFLALPDQQKIILLARLSHDLTIHGRAFALDLTGETQTAAFKGFNELQHQISRHMAHLAEASDRYPDDVLLEILQEKAAHYRISACLNQSLDDRAQRLTRRIPETS